MGRDLTTKTTAETMAEIINELYGKKEALKNLQAEVKKLEENEGEPNVIEVVEVNGEALEVTNKTVNVGVPTKVSQLENDEEYANADEVAAQIAKIIDDAPESFDTLKEIADWIESHADSAAEMNSQIKANTEDIDELKDYIGELPGGTVATTIVGYIQESVKDIDLTDYVKAEDLEDFTADEINALLSD